MLVFMVCGNKQQQNGIKTNCCGIYKAKYFGDIQFHDTENGHDTTIAKPTLIIIFINAKTYSNPNILYHSFHLGTPARSRTEKLTGLSRVHMP